MYVLKIKYKIYIKIIAIDTIKFFPTSITVIFVKMLFWKLVLKLVLKLVFIFYFKLFFFNMTNKMLLF